MYALTLTKLSDMLRAYSEYCMQEGALLNRIDMGGRCGGSTLPTHASTLACGGSILPCSCTKTNG